MLSGVVPMMGAPAAASARDNFSGVWPPNCTITPSGFSFSMISMTSSKVSGSKYKPIRGVVVGRDRLRIAVHHDGLEAVLAQRHGGVHAAIIEFDALADAIRAAAQDHDLAPAAGIRLALLFVGRIQVGGRGRELGGAGIDALVHRVQSQLAAPAADGRLRRAPPASRCAHRRSPCASSARRRGRSRLSKPSLASSGLLAQQVLDLRQKPGIDLGGVEHLLQRSSRRETRRPRTGFDPVPASAVRRTASRPPHR